MGKSIPSQMLPVPGSWKISLLGIFFLLKGPSDLYRLAACNKSYTALGQGQLCVCVCVCVCVIVNIVGVVGYVVSVTSIQCCHFKATGATDNKCDCVLIRLYLWTL